MKNPYLVVAAVTTLALATLSGAVLAHEFKSGPLTIDHPWARPSIGSAKNGAVYMKLENAGDTTDTLVSVKSDVAGNVSLHESRMDGDIMRMVPVEGGIKVPAHGSTALKPLGLHVMLIGLRQPLKKGETFPMTLVFEKQGDVAIDVRVNVPKSEAQEPDQHMHHNH